MSPIFYVNSAPHIGHLYTAILCDASARFERLKGNNVLFTIGTDEHGLKIQKKAIEAGYSDPKEMCDKNSEVFRRMFDQCGISYDRYIRTTDDDHKKAVAHFWQLLRERGFIKQGQHTGYYSTNEETFFVEKDLVKDDNGNLTVPHSGEVCE
jgi:methionyl-tRNA synthetase